MLVRMKCFEQLPLSIYNLLKQGASVSYPIMAAAVLSDCRSQQA